jgi:hypothetical protein
MNGMEHTFFNLAEVSMTVSVNAVVLAMGKDDQKHDFFVTES